MNKYATEQQFGGQRASVGRSVIVVGDGQLAAGQIVGISVNDSPIIRSVAVVGSGEWKVVNTCAFREVLSATELEAVVETATESFWTWPPRV